MIAPAPSVVARDLGRIDDLLAKLDDDYRWLYELAWCAQVNGEGGSGEEDKVLSIVLGQRAARARVTGAAQAVDKALKALLHAEAMLGEVADIADRRIPQRPEHHERFVPRTVSKAELREARKAARRRRERGEGYGVG